MKKRLLSLLLILAMVLTIGAPLTAGATDAGQTEYQSYGTVVNPLYPNFTPPAYTPAARPETPANVAGQREENFVSPTQAADQLRIAMINRRPGAELYIDLSSVGYIDSIGDWLGNYLFPMAYSMDLAVGNYDGDYLMWSWQYYNWSIESWDGDYLAVYFELYFYSNASQEAFVDQEVQRLTGALGLRSLAPYDAYRKVYEYLTSTMTYDYTGLATFDDDYYDYETYEYVDPMGNDDYLIYTAYKGLATGTFVCQGYSQLMYALCRNADLPVRMITSYDHAWNIVYLDGWWYNVDATWDGGLPEARWDYFLVGMDNFEDAPSHIREYPWNTAEFDAAYPTSDTDYGSSAPHVKKYALYIDSIRVTDDNRSDVLGNGLFSFDGDHTLTVKGSYTAYSGNAIASEISGLVINVAANATFSCYDGATIYSSGDLTITGPGKLTLTSNADCGIYMVNGAGLTIQDANVAASGQWGITGNGAGETLTVSSSNVTASGGNGAICDFGQIILDNETVVAPSGGYVSYGNVVDSYGSVATNVTLAPAHVHHLTKVPGTPATCTEAGVKDYWYCADCGKLFSDAAGKTEISAPVKIPALGHSWGEWIVVKEATTEEEGLMQRVCQNDPSHVEEKIIPVIDPRNPFVDLEREMYYYEPVIWAVQHDPQITNGVDATHFGPDRTCTRGQVVTFLWRAMGCPEPTMTLNPFVDVDSSMYYYKPVLWALQNGITNGTDATHFSPDAPCTRGQVVTFLWRAEGSPAPTLGMNPFTDVDTAFYYYSPVLWAVQNGITNGTDSSHFSPDRTCTRGQIVTFLYRDIG